MNEEEADGDDRTAVALHYSIDVSTANHRLSDAERVAMRRMIQLTLGELKAKLQFVLDDPGNAKATAHIASSSSGRRELSPLEESTLADEQVYDARERVAMKWMD